MVFRFCWTSLPACTSSCPASICSHVSLVCPLRPSLAALAPLTCLLSIDVSNNNIPSLSELSACSQAVLLGSLDVRGNPVQRSMAVRLHAVHLLPQVAVLNGEEVSAKEKVRGQGRRGGAG